MFNSKHLAAVTPRWISPKEDRRRFMRAPLRLEGRFLGPQSEEHALLTQDISCNGAHVLSKTRPSINSPLVCYIDGFARVSGNVLRHTNKGFVVGFDISDHKRDKLADRLTWLMNSAQLGLEEDRTETRFPASGPCIVRRENAPSLQCRVMDISLSGASFEADGPAPRMGEVVEAGSLRGEVVRRDRTSFAIQFITPADLEREKLLDLRRRFRQKFEDSAA